MSQNLKEKILNRMQELSSEIEALVEERSSHYERIDEINTRMAHIVGAMQELDSLKGEEEEKCVTTESQA